MLALLAKIFLIIYFEIFDDRKNVDWKKGNNSVLAC